jgi:tocopherol O-methyltransferase
MVTDRAVRRLVLSSATRSRSFVLSLPRLMVALRTGAMRYGVFVWDKPSRTRAGREASWPT